MARLYVPLDVDFPTDDKILAAGPLAGYLYVCSLAFAKRTLSDGKITSAQLAVIAPGLTNVKKHAARLVESKLWRDVDDGWVIVAWAKRNKLADEVTAAADAKRERSQAANHQRWHVDLGRTLDSCPLCFPTKDPTGIQQGVPPGSFEDPKPFTETETKPEAIREDSFDDPLPGPDQARQHLIAAKAALHDDRPFGFHRPALHPVLP